MPLSDDYKGASQWKAWGMDSLGSSGTSGAGSAPAGSATTPNDDDQRKSDEFRHLSEIKKLREQVLEAAREEGFAAGFAAARDEGYAKGHEEGVLAGEAEMREKIKLALEPVRHLALGFSTALNSLDVEMSDQLAAIALKIGHQLALDGIKQNPEAVVNLVRSVLHSDPEMIGKPRMRVNPDDAQMITDAFGSEIEALGWKVIPDDQITRGGCKVMSTQGEIDATWESRWESIQKEFSREKAGE